MCRFYMLPNIYTIFFFGLGTVLNMQTDVLALFDSRILQKQISALEPQLLSSTNLNPPSRFIPTADTRPPIALTVPLQ